MRTALAVASGTAIAVWTILALPGRASGDVSAHTRYSSPVEIALSPNGARLYAVCEGTDELAAIDLARGTVAGRVKVGRVPKGIFVSADGKHIYVANSWSDTISEIDAAALRVVRTLPAGFEPKSGSVSPKQPTAFPLCSRGSHRVFCSSEPYA